MPNSSAIKHLTSKDPVFGKIIKRIKLPQDRKRRPNYFRSLTSAIINQQLSGKAADKIEARFKALFPGRAFPSPEQVLKTPNRKLRKAGLSQMKINYIKGLAKKIKNQEINFKKIVRLEDEEVIIELTELKGIGRWTAEMFLMFSLRREDVFSAGDFGLRTAIKKIYRLKDLPDEKTAKRIAEKWSPHRTLACRYLWASTDSK